MLTATHDVLLARARHRRVDESAHCEPFHVPPEATDDKPAAKAPAKGGAAAAAAAAAAATAAAQGTPPLLPRKADGSVDKERLARLVPRHDDSQENVKERLRLWDLHLADVRFRFTF